MTKSVNPHILLFDWLIKVISEILPPLPKSLFCGIMFPASWEFQATGLAGRRAWIFLGHPKPPNVKLSPASMDAVVCASRIATRAALGSQLI